MSDLLGLLTLDLGFAATGWLLLQALGFAPSLRRPAWIGCAFFVGWSAVGVGLTVLLALGTSAAPIVVLALMLALAVLALAVAVRRSPAPLPDVRADDRTGRSLQALGTTAVVVLLGTALVRALYGGADTNWDSWAFWIAKARSIYYYGGLDAGAGGITTYANPEYPPLVPIQQAVTFGFTGSGSAVLLPFQQVVLAVAFFGALAVLLRTRVSPALLWPLLALLAAAPTLSHYYPSALADPPLSYTVALAGVAASLWWLDRDRRWRDVTALLLASAALIKSEGLLFAVLLATLLLGLALWERRSRRDAVALLVVPVAVLLPWKIWLAANAQELGSPYYSWSTFLHPVLLAERLDRLTFALEAMLRMALAPGNWLLLLPLALVCAALALRVHSALGLLAAGWLAFGFLGLAAVYWIGTLPVDWWVDTSVERILLSIGTSAGALAPLLLAEALSPRAAQRRPPVPPL